MEKRGVVSEDERDREKKWQLQDISKMARERRGDGEGQIETKRWKHKHLFTDDNEKKLDWSIV